MPLCPKCRHRLEKVRTPFGVVFHCADCGGRMLGLATLRRDAIDDEFRARLWQGSRYSGAGSKVCPHCGQGMRPVEVPLGGGSLELDVCRHCQCIWFDPEEYGRVPHEAVAAKGAVGSPDPDLPDLPRDLWAREAAALLELRSVKESQQREDVGPAAPTEVWKWLVGLLGMPVELSQPPLTSRPLATWTIGAVLAGAFLLSLANLRGAVEDLAFVPADWSRLGGLTLITSFFLHAGWFHLLSNLYFLLVFGDNVEDRLSTGRYLLLILLGHVAGMALQGTFGPRPDVPVVGASAGISAAVAFYALAFPHSRLGLLFFYIFWARIPAWVLLFFYGILQVVGAVLSAGSPGGVAYLGHIGGLIVGIVAAVVWRSGRNRRLLASTGRDYRKSERGGWQ